MGSGEGEAAVAQALGPEAEPPASLLSGVAPSHLATKRVEAEGTQKASVKYALPAFCFHMSPWAHFCVLSLARSMMCGMRGSSGLQSEGVTPAIEASFGCMHGAPFLPTSAMILLSCSKTIRVNSTLPCIRFASCKLAPFALHVIVISTSSKRSCLIVILKPFVALLPSTNNCGSALNAIFMAQAAQEQPESQSRVGRQRDRCAGQQSAQAVRYFSIPQRSHASSGGRRPILTNILPSKA